MEISEQAELQTLLEGVPLPAEKQELLAYAAREGADARQLAALRTVPSGSYDSIDDVGEELVRVQPPRRREQPHSPGEESGAPPGGPDYTRAHPQSGEVRDKDAVSG
ncbi:MAG TPA: DUF2795 domain-containing protein [Gaiellaceae bacterium]|nr:DUF2795 domain-containing protein [Gaiellaceae bacterium]